MYARLLEVVASCIALSAWGDFEGILGSSKVRIQSTQDASIENSATIRLERHGVGSTNAFTYAAVVNHFSQADVDELKRLVQ